MNDTIDHKTGIESAAGQNSEDVSHGQVVGYIDPVKEAKMMRKFDVRGSVVTYSRNPKLICANSVLGSRSSRHSLHVGKSRPVSLLMAPGQIEQIMTATNAALTGATLGMHRLRDSQMTWDLLEINTERQ